MRLASMVLLAALFGCSSPSFDVPAGGDSAAADTSSPVDSTVEDSVVEDTEPPPMSDAPCAPLGTSSTVYVDARATRTPIGSAECPAKTIADGLAIVAGLLPAKRTIRIAGTTGTPLVYNETSVLRVKPGTAIVGTGITQVTVTGGAVCEKTNCLFVLEGATSIEGLTINSSGAIGLAIGPGESTISTAKSVLVTGGTNAASVGVYINGPGSVELGPDLRVKDNAGVGLSIDVAASTKVVGSSFNDNLSGIIVRGGPIDIQNTAALRNKVHGVSLLSNAAHTITGLDARDNLLNGVYVESNASLKMRGSTLIKNRVGLVFRFGASNVLDLGTTGEPGGNYLGGKAGINNRAAVCLPISRATKAPAIANKWSVCDPTRVSLLGGAGCESITGYQDIYYAPFNTADPPPLDWTSCSEGM
jgi:hypothetical protein